MKKLLSLFLFMALALVPVSAKPALDSQVPPKLQTATFGLGCYWTSDSLMGSLPGVIRTRVGFCKDAEVVQVDFDPKVITYEALLELFWSAHDPASPNDTRMYQKAVFFHNDQQNKLARASREAQARKLGHPATSTIEPVQFEQARAADQKYYLRKSALWNDFKRQFNDDSEIANSPAAAKINGYLGGNSDQSQFQLYAANLGLSKESLQALSRKVPETARHFTPHCTLPRD